MVSSKGVRTTHAIVTSNAIAERVIEKLDTAMRFNDTYVREIIVHRTSLALEPIPKPAHANSCGPWKSSSRRGELERIADGEPLVTERQSGARKYKIEVITEGALGTLFAGSSKMPVEKMEEVLNRYGQMGWRMDFMIVEQRRMALFWKREAAVITFSRGA